MRYQGVVIRVGARGFGWIEVDGTRTSLFFHINDVIGRLNLRAGDRVEFQIQNAPKGDKAIQVTLLSSPDRLDRQGVQREVQQ